MIEEIKPVAIFKTPAGERIIDMGQNMVGWVKFKVRGEKGNKVILKFGEILTKEGNFYDGNLRTARQTDEFILNGGGEEYFEPHFTYHGFRYIKLIEFPNEPFLHDFTGCVIHSRMEETSSFICSNPYINKFHKNVL